MQEETIDPRELNPLALAFVGDSVLELLVRTRLARHHRMSAGKLNVEKVKYVSARAHDVICEVNIVESIHYRPDTEDYTQIIPEICLSDLSN